MPQSILRFLRRMRRGVEGGLVGEVSNIGNSMDGMIDGRVNRKSGRRWLSPVRHFTLLPVVSAWIARICILQAKCLLLLTIKGYVPDRSFPSQ